MGRGDDGAIVLRGNLRPGDLAWVVHRHGVIYAEEFGRDHRFETLVAGIVGAFGGGHDPAPERCWIAERAGRFVGCVFLVRDSDEEGTARLRLLLVEPDARRFGLGGRLVDGCVRFGRAAGYRRISPWTNDVLVAARSLYEAAGFRLVSAEPHRSFGHDLGGETWSLPLSSSDR